MLDRGEEADRAEEIAARTVDQVRAQTGEAARSSPTSTGDVSPAHRGGRRSHSGAGRTKAQLHQEARRQHVTGRSSMTKAELERAVR